MKKRWLPLAVGFLIVLAFIGHATGWWRVSAIDRLEYLLYDARLRLTKPPVVDARRIVIVDIDEKSLLEVGRWPWPRDRFGALLDRLFDHYQVEVAAFDIVWADEERGSEQLDQAFAQKIGRRPVVLGYYFSKTSSARIGKLPDWALEKGAFAGRVAYPERQTGYGANLPVLMAAGAGRHSTAGHFNPAIDPDGVIRRVPLLLECECDGAYYESLSLAVVRLLQGAPVLKPVFREATLGSMGYAGLVGIDVGALHIPVDVAATALVPYRGAARSFPYVSASDVLQRNADPDVFKKSIVLVGSSAPGAQDVRLTPVGLYPGVEIHASLIAGMLDGTIKQHPDFAVVVEVFSLFCLGAAMALILPFLDALRATLATLVLVIAVLTIDIYSWSQANLVLPLASQLLLLLLLFAFNVPYAFLAAIRAERRITALFGQYVPPELCTVPAAWPAGFLRRAMKGTSDSLKTQR